MFEFTQFIDARLVAQQERRCSSDLRIKCLCDYDCCKDWFRFLSIPSNASMLFPCRFSHLRFKNLSPLCIEMSTWKSDLVGGGLIESCRVIGYKSSAIKAPNLIYETCWTRPPSVISNMSPPPPLLSPLSFIWISSLPESQQSALIWHKLSAGSNRQILWNVK